MDARDDNYNATSLHHAAWNGHLQVVKLLLARGAEVDARNKFDATPLLNAARQGHLQVSERDKWGQH